MGMSFSKCRGFGLLLLLFAVMGMPAAAQEKDVDVRQELTELRKEIAELRTELAALKAARPVIQPSDQPTTSGSRRRTPSNPGSRTRADQGGIHVAISGEAVRHGTRACLCQFRDAELARHPEPGQSATS